jgi:hypothetical protein
MQDWTQATKPRAGGLHTPMHQTHTLVGATAGGSEWGAAPSKSHTTDSAHHPRLADWMGQPITTPRNPISRCTFAACTAHAAHRAVASKGDQGGGGGHSAHRCTHARAWAQPSQRRRVGSHTTQQNKSRGAEGAEPRRARAVQAGSVTRSMHRIPHWCVQAVENTRGTSSSVRQAQRGGGGCCTITQGWNPEARPPPPLNAAESHVRGAPARGVPSRCARRRTGRYRGESGKRCKDGGRGGGRPRVRHNQRRVTHAKRRISAVEKERCP